jgi:large subunit ribosomal protein L4
MQLTVRSVTGEVVGQVEGSDAVFGAPPNPDLLHQALVYHQANQRQGSSSTLTRGLVSGGGRKPFAQKGTGRARQGSTRSPLQRHGGITFGPSPRSYRQRMPKRMRRQAIRTALSGKLAGERLIVLRGLDEVEGKTKNMAALMAALEVTGSTLVVLRDEQPETARAFRNLPRLKVARADLLNVLDLLRYQTLIMDTAAVERADELWADISRGRAKGAGSSSEEEAASV